MSRVRGLSFGATCLVASFSMGIALADEPTYDKQTLVPIDGAGQVLVFDPIQKKYIPDLSVGGVPRGPSSTEVPVPFPVPKPVPLTDPRTDADLFRTLAALQAILANPGKADPTIVTKKSLGTAPGTKDGSIAAESIDSVTVAATVLPFEFPGVPGDGLKVIDLRPDGSEKGVALFSAGVHPREWMAPDGLMRRFEAFVDGKFEANLKALRGRTAAGDVNAFYAENVKIVFVPVVTPSALKLTQDDFDQCYMITNDTQGSELNRGYLRHGRFRRKNLRHVDKSVLSTAAAAKNDKTALFGVNINRNLTKDSFKLKDEALTIHASSQYRGTHARSEHESKAFALAVEDAFGGTASVRHTGAAFLDIHTDDDSVLYPPAAATKPTFVAYAKAVNSFARAGKGAVVSAILGTTDDYVLNTRGIPAATLELPTDPGVVTMRGQGPAFTPFPTGRSYRDNTGKTLGFVVSEGTQYKTQSDEVTLGVDAGLEWAAGPPYVREVVLLQKKPTSAVGANQYDRVALEGDAEVAYYKAWAPLEPLGSSSVRVQQPRAKGSRWANGSTEVKLMVLFSKPMRDAASAAIPIAVDPMTGPVTTLEIVRTDATSTNVFTVPAKGEWMTKTLAKGLTKDGTDPIEVGAKRYDYDTWTATFDLPASLTVKGDARFRIQVGDRIGLLLDANPGSVAGWQSGDWVDYQRGGDRGSKTDADETNDGFQVDTVNPVFKTLP